MMHPPRNHWRGSWLRKLRIGTAHAGPSPRPIVSTKANERLEWFVPFQTFICFGKNSEHVYDLPFSHTHREKSVCERRVSYTHLFYSPNAPISRHQRHLCLVVVDRAGHDFAFFVRHELPHIKLCKQHLEPARFSDACCYVQVALTVWAFRESATNSFSCLIFSICLHISGSPPTLSLQEANNTAFDVVRN